MAALLAAAHPVSAQSRGLEERRDAVFAQILRDPTDINLMLSYARLSVEMRDYEQVVATLERVLDLEPDRAEARLELAVGYYALGAYDLALFHFNALEQVDALPPEVIAQIERYSDTANDRIQPRVLTGFIEAGPTRAMVEGQTGLELGLGLTWRIDMGRDDDADWVTDFYLQTLRFPDDDDLSVGYVLLRSGPEFSLDGSAYGARLRPYAALTSSVDFDLDDRSTLGLGLQYSNSFNADWSIFGTLEGGYLRRTDLDADGTFANGRFGVTHYFSIDTALRASIRARHDETDLDTTDVTSWGGRIDLSHSFRPDWSASDRKWLVSAYALYDVQDYRSISPARTDHLTGYGVSLRAYVRGDTYLEARADRLDRDTDVDGVADSRQVVGLLLGTEF